MDQTLAGISTMDQKAPNIFFDAPKAKTKQNMILFF